MQWPHQAGHSSLVFVLTRGADLSSKLRCAVGGFKQQPGGLILRTMEALLILASILMLLSAYLDLYMMCLRLKFTGRKRPSVTDMEPSLGE